MVHAPQETVSDPPFRRALGRVEAKLKRDPAVRNVEPPRAAVSISRNRHTAVIRAGAERDPNDTGALAVLAPLGFAALPGAPVRIGEDAYFTLVNDFGPGSVDEWLSEAVGRELAADEPPVLDPGARRLVLDGREIDLTRLELDVLRHLQGREGIAVTREELLREVWDTNGRAQARTSSRRSSAAYERRWVTAPPRSRPSAASATD